MTKDFIIIAHRGASARYPENTLLAFGKALEGGATWLELDVHLSADGRLVVIHDEYLERTTNGRGLVDEMSLAQLRQLNAGLGERIPLLEEVLDLAAGRATVNIELKGKATAAPVAQLLQQRIASGCLHLEEILVSSLDENELIRFGQLQTGVRMAPVADRPDHRFWQLADKLDAWSVHIEAAAVSPELVAKARLQERRVLVYTVNDQETLTALVKLGVDGVFTDLPEFLKNS